MKVGWVGLGKLGLPCATVLAQHHDVWGYDVSDRPWNIMRSPGLGNREEGLRELLSDEDRRVQRCDSVADVVKQADVIFVAVQTPHAPEYGGDRPKPGPERDFEYAYLVQACRDIARAAAAQEKDITVAVVSTVLPGTTDRLVRPVLNGRTRLVYTPQFIAMGTTIADFRDPEFVICGTDDLKAVDDIVSVFSPVHGEDRTFHCDIVTAEAIKVFYNTFISMKIVWANAVMEMCHAMGADCNTVVDALSLATDRVISDMYLRGGMGDGGACHPRDLIALEFLESRVQASYPLFGELRKAREQQTRWLARLVKSYADQTSLPVILLGRAYKPQSDLVDGSPALLLQHCLRELEQYASHVFDPYCGPATPPADKMRPAVYVITTRHQEWKRLNFPQGSVVIDVFGYLSDQPGVTMVRVGRR